MNSKTKKIIKTTIAVLIIFIVLYFIAYNLATRWNELKQYSLNFEMGYILVFLIIIFLFYFIVPGIWALSLILLGQKIPYRKILKIWNSAQLVRYVPGNIAFFLGRIELGKKEGIPREKNLVAISIELILIVLACLTIFLFYILFSAEKISWLIFLLIPAGIIFLHPKILLPVANWLLRIIKRPEIDCKISYKKILILFLFVLFTQAIEGIAYAFLLRSVFNYPLNLYSVLKFAAIYEGAWVIGFLSFFTPSGIGIREAALIFLLKPYMPLTAAIVFSIFARICCIIVEVLIASCVLAFNKIKDKKEERIKKVKN